MYPALLILTQRPLLGGAMHGFKLQLRTRMMRAPLGQEIQNPQSESPEAARKHLNNMSIFDTDLKFYGSFDYYITISSRTQSKQPPP